mmetsp:Transcript_23591/g.55878  ORF Transcript_23591/g.55878 Transcript_23591/m.55878 type:complete len:183 (+) Transcript_23591:156-704(+)|eukprot:CAMPEP_0113502290 /NCGR_PEP_ID=MMETSP0014_2-20120614/33460_1 /TAXON_ID=2857 /ORGANISM="Nitzschia sp." /LENGTH=182 /DNA_ID=CAMNT_0000397037 /DNA_START=58 /DNA_END=606 /DNA_ORIENTATION=+ /assembly_acc=CAM_ASM_000159
MSTDQEEDTKLTAAGENTSAVSSTSPSASASASQHKCPVCAKPASKRCSRCHQVWYCSTDCQKRHWKVGGHKQVCDSLFQSNQYELHKKAFDVISQKYKLNDDKKATEIADLLTNGVDAITAPEFASKFSMELAEAVTFLEWIKIGVTFKEQSIDTAKKAGLSSSPNNNDLQTFKVDAKNLR